MDRIGFLELLNRTRDLTPEETDELVYLVANQKRSARRRSWYRETSQTPRIRDRYRTDPEYRRKRLETNERCRLRRAGRI